MPCKQAAVDVADVVEPLPRLLHAANTLVRTDGGLAGGEHRRRRRRHGAAAGRGRAGRPQPRSSAPAGRRPPRPWPWRRSGPSTSTSSSANRRGPRDLVRVLGCSACSTAGDDRLDGARPSTRPVVVSTVPVDAQPGLLAAALAGRPDRARRAVRAVADAAGAAGPGRRRHRHRRPRGALLAGHRPGRADDRSAGADRARCAAALDAAVAAALSRPWSSSRPVLLGAAPGARRRGGAVARRRSPPGWPPGTTPLGRRRARTAVCSTALFAALLAGARALRPVLRPATAACLGRRRRRRARRRSTWPCHRLPDRVTYPAYAVCGGALLVDAAVHGDVAGPADRRRSPRPRPSRVGGAGRGRSPPRGWASAT